MKTTIKVKVLTKGCEPQIIELGDWIDLKAAKDVELKLPESSTLKRSTNTREVTFNSTLVPLGVAMKLPDGYEAVVLPRSSSYKKFGIMQTNSAGVIDFTYSGNNDEWKLPIIAMNNVKINKGDRVCQFRIQLSQKATLWQKLKWLFSNGVKIKFVDNLNGSDRKGFGSTGVK